MTDPAPGSKLIWYINPDFRKIFFFLQGSNQWKKLLHNTALDKTFMFSVFYMCKELWIIIGAEHKILLMVFV